MVSIEEVITQLKRLTPEQVDEVARIIHGLSCVERPDAPRHSALPALVIDEAVQHGWPGAVVRGSDRQSSGSRACASAAREKPA